MRGRIKAARLRQGEARETSNQFSRTPHSPLPPKLDSLLESPIEWPLVSLHAYYTMIQITCMNMFS